MDRNVQTKTLTGEKFLKRTRTSWQCFMGFHRSAAKPLIEIIRPLSKNWSGWFFVFQAGEGIDLVGWRKIDFSEAMYAAHLYILKLVAKKHDAAF